MQQYNLRLFTDTNSVICKIIVGRGFTPAAYKNVPNGGSKPPPYDVICKKRRKIYEGNRYRKKSGHPLTDNIDTSRQILYGDT